MKAVKYISWFSDSWPHAVCTTLSWYYNLIIESSILFGKSCRCIRMLFCKTSTDLLSSVRHCTPDARTKWISFKFSDFLPWQNLMQVSCNAIIVLIMSALDLQRQVTRHGWWRFDAIIFLINNWVVSILHEVNKLC